MVKVDAFPIVTGIPGRGQCHHTIDALQTSKRHSFSNDKYYPLPQIAHIRSSSSRTMLCMKWFDNLKTSLFLDGGAYDAGVDYSKLNHPGPELANAALSSTILSRSVRDPSLEIATFA
eukprot:11249692-Ditylum_brightwellii.AAC.1